MGNSKKQTGIAYNYIHDLTPLSFNCSNFRFTDLKSNAARMLMQLPLAINIINNNTLMAFRRIFSSS